MPYRTACLQYSHLTHTPSPFYLLFTRPRFDTVGWVIWPAKTVPEMTYNVFSGTLNPTHSLSVENMQEWSAGFMLMIGRNRTSETAACWPVHTCCMYPDQFGVGWDSSRHIHPVLQSRSRLMLVGSVYGYNRINRCWYKPNDTDDKPGLSGKWYVSTGIPKLPTAVATGFLFTSCTACLSIACCCSSVGVDTAITPIPWNEPFPSSVAELWDCAVVKAN